MKVYSVNYLKWLLVSGLILIAHAYSLGQATNKTDVNASFVRISNENPAYFELSNGEPYVPVGANLCWAKDMPTLESYFKKTAENGGNYARIWLSHPLFEIENPDGKGVNEKALARIDTVFEFARKYHIKLKLCLEHFRRVSPEKDFVNKTYYHKDKGGPLTDMNEYVRSETGRQLYLNRVEVFRRRYGNDPMVFGWELWNEMNAIKADSIQAWNEYMLPKVHELFPKNLVMQSLGSFGSEKDRNIYRFINQLPANDVAQIHRYIDPGAPLAICTAPMDLLASNAIDELRSYQLVKPTLLAEVGAVKANHTGSSELNALDKDGMLLHDILFAPFFSGAAGTGMAWFWDRHIEQNNLWYHFGRFTEAIKGINPVQERFIPVKILHPKLRIYALVGRKTVLVWCRDAANDWQHELIQGIAPTVQQGLTVDLSNLVPHQLGKAVSFYNPWTNTWKTGQRETNLTLPDFTRSVVIRIEKK